MTNRKPPILALRALLISVPLFVCVAPPLSAQFASCTTAPAGSQCLSSGSVGIGTTSPAYSLEVGTGSQNTSTPSATVTFGAHGSALFGTGDATTLIDSLSNSGALYFNSGNGHPSFSVTRSSNITNNDYTIYSLRNLVFAPGPLWHSIFSVGNVGIGGAFSAGNGTSPTPPSSLSVAGGVSIGSYATSTTNAGAGNLNVSGSIGLGTQAPGYKLDVQGGQINASGGLCIAGTCQTSWPVSTNPWQGTGTIYYNGGRVGIGTSTPGNLLEISNNGSSTPGLLIGNGTGHFLLGVGARAANDGIFTLYDQTHGANRLVVDPGGNVGIGTSSPWAPLDVNASAYKLSTDSSVQELRPIFPDNAANAKIDVYLGQNASGESFWGVLDLELFAGYENENDTGFIHKRFYLGLYNNNQVLMKQSRVLDEGGAIASHYSISDVVWDSTQNKFKITIAHLTSAYSVPQLRLSQFTAPQAVPDSTNSILAATLGPVYTTDTTVFPRVYVNYNDPVGFGTTSPCASGAPVNCMMSVNGAIQAKEVVVNTGWSDYVFDPDYKLAPLSDVAAYVAEKHHLPDIPSAKEVQEKGVSLGDMQSKLLAKIEELTLHMIQSEERNTQLAERVEALQRQVAELKADRPERQQ